MYGLGGAFAGAGIGYGAGAAMFDNNGGGFFANMVGFYKGFFGNHEAVCWGGLDAANTGDWCLPPYLWEWLKGSGRGITEIARPLGEALPVIVKNALPPPNNNFPTPQPLPKPSQPKPPQPKPPTPPRERFLKRIYPSTPSVVDKNTSFEEDNDADDFSRQLKQQGFKRLTEISVTITYPSSLPLSNYPPVQGGGGVSYYRRAGRRTDNPRSQDNLLRPFTGIGNTPLQNLQIQGLGIANRIRSRFGGPTPKVNVSRGKGYSTVISIRGF